MVRAIVPSIISLSRRASLRPALGPSLGLALGVSLSASLVACVGSGQKAADDRSSATSSAKSLDTAPRSDVRVSLPTDPARTARGASGDARPDADAPLDLGTAAGLQAQLAEDSDQLQLRLAAALRKDETAKRSAPEAGRAAPPRTPETTPATTGAASLPSDPKALAQAIVSGLKTGATKDSGPVVAALLAASNALDHPDAPFDVNAYAGLSADDRELVMRFRESCAAIGRDARGNAPPPTTTVAATTSEAPAVAPAPATPSAAPAALPAKKPLAIPRFDLATRVDGYGKLTPVNDRRFLPGKPTQVILYVEVAEFDSERDERAGEWITSLASKVAIFAKHDGTEVWTRDWQAVTDRSAVKRSDFFICEKVTLSEYLTVGTYVMKASVRDEKTGAVAEKSIEFQVVADPSLAAK